VSRSIGIDIGSSYSKGVIIEDLEVVASHVLISGSDYRAAAGAIRAELLRESGLREDEIARMAATGCGADSVWFAERKASDLICAARGINRLFPQARTAIDVGSQSSRVIRLSPDGTVTNFAVTEKCAAGGGRFVEVIANVLRVHLSEFGLLAAKSRTPVIFSTGCAVFGETEAITRISEGSSQGGHRRRRHQCPGQQDRLPGQEGRPGGVLRHLRGRCPDHPAYPSDRGRAEDKAAGAPPPSGGGGARRGHCHRRSRARRIADPEQQITDKPQAQNAR
jgi:predicted CoA-substrate-specific enzyme activase